MNLKPRNIIIVGCILLGFTSVVTQIVLLREFLSIFYGIELVIGIILAIWMLLTGLGSLAGRRFSNKMTNINRLMILILLLGLIPPATLVGMDYMKHVLFTPGLMLNILEILVYSFLVLCPFCLLSGLGFTMFSVVMSSSYSSKSVRNAYAWESIGSLTGGLVFTFVFINLLSEWHMLMLVLTFNLILAMSMGVIFKKYGLSLVILILLLACTSLTVWSDIEAYATTFLFPGQEVLMKENTPYNQVIVTKTGDQANIYCNGQIIYAKDDVVSYEENIHYAMSQAQHADTLMILSGGYLSSIKEACKYPMVKHIDYFEPDPNLLKILNKYYIYKLSDTLNCEVDIINQDPRLYLKTNAYKYDVITINLPEPSTAQINRFYTLEFFKILKRNLSQKGVVSLSLPYAANYINPEAGKMNSCVFKALDLVFDHVLIIPGQKNYYLASDQCLDFQLTKRINNELIPTVYYNDYYLDTLLIKTRNKALMESMTPCHQLNTDFRPVGYFNHLMYWVSHFNIRPWFVLLMILVPILFVLFKLNSVNLGLFGGGFTASSLQFIFILAFQIIYGYVFQMLGLIITLFMAGLFLGSKVLITYIKNYSLQGYSIIQSAIGLFGITIPLALMGIGQYSNHAYLGHGVFFILITVFATCLGLQFAYATHLKKASISHIASSAYGSDLTGAAAGVLLTSALLIPLLGFLITGFILGGINLWVVVIMLARKRQND